MTAGTAADWPVHTTPSMPPSSLLLGGCINALEPNPLCPAVSATGASVDRASNRDPWGYGCQIASGVSRPGGQSPENLPRDAGEQRVHQQGEGEAEEKQSQPQPGPGRGGPTLWGLNPSRHSSGRHLPSLCVVQAWNSC